MSPDPAAAEVVAVGAAAAEVVVAVAAAVEAAAVTTPDAIEHERAPVGGALSPKPLPPILSNRSMTAASLWTHGGLILS